MKRKFFNPETLVIPVLATILSVSMAHAIYDMANILFEEGEKVRRSLPIVGDKDDDDDDFPPPSAVVTQGSNWDHWFNAVYHDF